MLTFSEFVQLQEGKYTVHFKKHGSNNEQTATVSADTEEDAKANFRKTHPDTTIVTISKSPGFLHKLFGTKPKKDKDSSHYKTNHHYGHSDIDPNTVPIFKPSWQNAR